MTLAIERDPARLRGAMPESTLMKLAALPAATDEEAGAATPPTLGLTDAEMDRVHALAEAWQDAKAEATKAEQVHTRARRVALQLPQLQRSAGEVAARAFGLNGHGHEMAADITRQIDTAQNAASALPALEREAAIARDRAANARGALHAATTSAIRMALRRASEHYSALALDLTRAVAAIEACVGALPNRTQTELVSPMALFAQHLSVPALGPELGVPHDRASAPGRYVPVLLTHDHPRAVVHTRAASGWLHQQLTEALGFSPHTLLG